MTENAWTSVTPQTDVVEQLRNDIRNVVPEEWTEETDPHISVLPGFEAPEDEMDGLLMDCMSENNDLVGEQINVTGFHCHNPIESNEPTFVIGLEVEFDLEETRDAQTELIEEAGGELLYDPVPAHITLFKEGDGGDDNDGLTGDQASTIQDRLSELSEDAHFETRAKKASAERF